MDAHDIQQAAALLAQARRSMRPLPGLPEALQPASIAEAHAIQDATTTLLGKPVGGYKASAPVDGETSRGVIYADTILPSPATFPADRAPACGVEAEIAFLFTRDFPPNDRSYMRDDVAAGTEALVAIEIVDSRYGDRVKDTGRLSKLEILADSTSNGGFVFGVPVRDWTSRVVPALTVTLVVNGQTIVHQNGGHPTGDPFAAAVALVNMMRSGEGIRAGHYVTCGSWTGLRWFRPGDRCLARFAGLGEAEVTFTA